MAEQPLPESSVNWAERWRSAAPPFILQAGGPFSEHDSFGRKKLRRLQEPDYLLLIAQSEPARVRRVPTDAITLEGIDETGSFSFVSCPCGGRPVVRPSLEKCPGCERYYVQIQPGGVWVAYGEMPLPPLPTS